DPVVPDSDGADGFGFRTRIVATHTSASNGIEQWQYGGEVYGPYVNPDQFKQTLFNGAVMLADHLGNPVLYYPALPVRYDLARPGAYVASYHPEFGVGPAPLFNAYDNELQDGELLPVSVLQEELQANSDGSLKGAQAPRLGAYLLWSARPDGVSGSEGDVKRVGAGGRLPGMPTGSQHQITAGQPDSGMPA